MKKTIKLFGIIALVAIIGLSLVTCGDGGDSGDDGGGEGSGATQKFWAADENNKAYEVTATQLAANSRCEVWVENGSGVTQADARRIAAEFNNIYSKNIAAFSKSMSVDGHSFPNTMAVAYYWFEEICEIKYSKLTILCLDIKDGYRKDTDPFVAGYFASRDFFPNSELVKYYPNLRSNERPMIYMDTYPTLDVYEWSKFYSTIAHEMQHLMNCTIDMVSDDRNTDTWINEGLSAAAEWNYAGGHVQQRIDWFSEDPTGFIAQGNNFYVWDNYSNQDSRANLDDYATVYLFFQWLRLNAGGTNVYKEIMNSRYGDYRAVVNAASGYSTWPALLEGWLRANYYKNSSNGYGSDSKLNREVQINYAPGRSGGPFSFQLYPGEAVYSKANAFTVPSGGTYITNKGLGSNGTVVSSGSFTGALLSFNTNTNIEGSAANGVITGVADIVAFRQIPDSLRGSYSISRTEMLRRRGITGEESDFTAHSSKLFKGVLVE